jgi:hypothetical protein
MASTSSSSGSGPNSRADFFWLIVLGWIAAVLIVMMLLNGVPLNDKAISSFLTRSIHRHDWAVFVVPVVLVTLVLVAGGAVFLRYRQRNHKGADTPLSRQRTLDAVLTSERSWRETASPHAALNGAAAVRPDLPQITVVPVSDGWIPNSVGITDKQLVHYATPIGWLADSDQLSASWYSVLDENKDKTTRTKQKNRRKFPVWISNELSVIILGPPRSGKNLTLVNSIAALHDGPTLITGARADIVMSVGAYRALRANRPVIVLDPERQIGELPIWLKRGWVDLLHGCTRPSVALRRFLHLAATQQRIERAESGTTGGDGRVEEFYVRQAAQIIAACAVVESVRAQAENRPTDIQRVAWRFRAIINSARGISSGSNDTRRNNPNTLEGLAHDLEQIRNEILMQHLVDRLGSLTNLDTNQLTTWMTAFLLYPLRSEIRVAQHPRGEEVASWLERHLASQEVEFRTTSASGMHVTVPKVMIITATVGALLEQLVFAMATTLLPTDEPRARINAMARAGLGSSLGISWKVMTSYLPEPLSQRILANSGDVARKLLHASGQFATLQRRLEALIATMSDNGIITRNQNTLSLSEDIMRLYRIGHQAHPPRRGSGHADAAASETATFVRQYPFHALTVVLADLLAQARNALAVGNAVEPGRALLTLVPLLEWLVTELARLLPEENIAAEMRHVGSPFEMMDARQSLSMVPSLHKLDGWAVAVHGDTELQKRTLGFMKTFEDARLQQQMDALFARTDDPEAAELANMQKTIEAQATKTDDTYQTFMMSFAEKLIELVDSPLVASITQASPGAVRVDPRNALDPRSTVFLIASATQQRLIAPVIVALISDVVAASATVRAEQQRERNDGNARLAPPLGLILDEFTSLAPLPADLITEILTTGSGSGIRLVAVIQSMRLVESIYGTLARGILDNAGVLIVLPGLTEVDTEALARRVGSATVMIRRGNDDSITKSIEETQIIAPHQIAALPRNLDLAKEPNRRWSTALMLRQGYPPIVIEMPAFVEAPWFIDSQQILQKAKSGVA